MTILELHEKRNTAWNAAKAFLDSHRTKNGTLTAEDGRYLLQNGTAHRWPRQGRGRAG
jgi:hypothetical protein